MKKILYSLLIILLFIPLVFIYIVFNENPLAKMQAKKDLQAYLAETYPNDTFQIKSNRFDPEFAYYWFDVSIDNDLEKQTYLFEVPTSFSQDQEIEDGIFYANLDEPLIDKWTKQAKEAIKQILESDVQAICKLDLYMYVLQDKYDINEECTPEKIWINQWKSI